MSDSLFEKNDRKPTVAETFIDKLNDEQKKVLCESRKIREIDSFLRKVEIFPGTIDDYKKTYCQVEPIKLDSLIKGIYIIHVNNILIDDEKNNTRSNHDCLTVVGADPEFLMKEGMIAIVNAHPITNPQYFNYESTYLESNFFGLPVRRYI